MPSLDYSLVYGGPVLNLEFIERTPSSIASALKHLDTEGKDLAAVRDALAEIDAQRKEADEQAQAAKALQDAAKEAKEQRLARRFIAAYRTRTGSVGTVHGIEHTNGYTHVRATMHSPCQIDGGHSSMTAMKVKLDDAGIVHHIEYID